MLLQANLIVGFCCTSSSKGFIYCRGRLLCRLPFLPSVPSSFSLSALPILSLSLLFFLPNNLVISVRISFSQGKVHVPTWMEQLEGFQHCTWTHLVCGDTSAMIKHLSYVFLIWFKVCSSVRSTTLWTSCPTLVLSESNSVLKYLNLQQDHIPLLVIDHP